VGAVRPASALGHDLRRAAAQLQCIALLTRKDTDPETTRPLQTAQEQFARYCALADVRLAMAPGPITDRGPQGESVGAWLAKMRAEKDRLMRTIPPTGRHTFAGQTGAAQRRGSGQSVTILPARGLPSYWVSDSPDDYPELRLSARAGRFSRQSLVASGLLFLALAGVWGLSYVPRLGRVLQVTWPEQVMVLGWLLWQMLGYPWAGAVVLLGAGARLYVLGRELPRLLRRARPAPAPAGGQAPGS
jgi:hypothetical protein